MKQLEQAFHYQGHQVRAVLQDGDPWFVATDVVRVLDLAGDAGQHLRRLDEDEKGLISIQTPGGLQSVLAVTEPGLYSLVLASRKPEAKGFRRWVTHEVIPSIRNNGLYVTEALLDNPEHLLKVTQRLVDERQARLAAESKVLELAPKAAFHDAVAAASDAQSIRDVAKILGTGQNRLFDWLREQHILMIDNRPYQDYIDAGYFRVIEQTWRDSGGEVHLSTKTLVTGKGLIYLRKRFGRSGPSIPPQAVEM